MSPFLPSCTIKKFPTSNSRDPYSFIYINWVYSILCSALLHSVHSWWGCSACLCLVKSYLTNCSVRILWRFSDLWCWEVCKFWLARAINIFNVPPDMIVNKHVLMCLFWSFCSIKFALFQSWNKHPHQVLISNGRINCTGVLMSMNDTVSLFPKTKL